MNNYPDLSSVQNKLLHYYAKHIHSKGIVPSLRQAAVDNGVSHAAIAQTLRALEAKGYIRRQDKYSRMIHLIKPYGEADAEIRNRMIPVIGTIAAGAPLYAQQQWDGMVAVDSSIYRGDHLFALRISGDSMKDAGILDGDLVICEPRQFARNGEIVAALINHEEATVKRFFRRKNHIELKPENPALKTIKYAFEEVLVQGKVVGLIRGPEAFAG
jgi:repressor LexA